MPAAAPLPTYLTPLVGRDRDLSEVASLVHAGRLVTLAGAGGSGKTRLAAAAASGLQPRFPDYFAWADLAPLTDPALLPGHVAALLGVREEAARPAVDSIAVAIGRRDALLVLDSCEHLVDACAELAGTLLRACPGLRVLATSRQALGITGEKVWVVPPLELPRPGDEERAAECSAIQLFAQRARDAVATFALGETNRAAVVRICRRVDGLPLAIELAAARVRVLPPEQLARRLDEALGILTNADRSTLPRHRTLRALIDWSYGLLSAEEQQLLERLAIFAGGFTLDSAESVVAYGDLARADLLDLLAALVDKSLVTVHERGGEARYTLLETVREYAHERLRSRSEAPADARAVHVLADRHAYHYLELAERAAAQLHRAAQLEWLSRLDAEDDNLRAALRWSLSSDQGDLAMRLCVAMRDYWRMRGHLTEGVRWMDETLQAGADAADALRARVLVGSGVLARRLGALDVFRERVVEGERIARRLGETRTLASALTQLGVHHRDLGDPARARTLLDEALALWRGAHDAWGVTVTLCARSAIAHAEHDLPLARTLRLEALEVSETAGDREGQALALIGLGELARGENDVLVARDYYARSLSLFRELGDTWHVAALLHNQGWLAAESGERQAARELFSRALSMFDSDRSLLLAPSLLGLARVLAETNEPEQAAIAYGSATSFMERERLRPAGADARSIERTRVIIEAALGPETFVHAVARGARMAARQLFREAVEMLERNDAARASSETPSEVEALPAPHDVAASNQLGVLTVRALGALEIRADGVTVEPEAFGSRRARELLLLLLTKPDGCTREQVGLAFWPDAAPAEVKNRFHVTLHRLRKALGHENWAVVADDRYRIAPAVRVEFDASRFEREASAGLRDVRAGKGDAGRLATALSLYGGDFLEHEGAGDWHLEPRERLRRLFIDAQLARGDLLFLSGKHSEAAAAWRELLAREPLHEPACRRLMDVSARIGERAEALRQYERFALLLRDAFDAEPEPETVALYEQLQRGAASA